MARRNSTILSAGWLQKEFHADRLYLGKGSSGAMVAAWTGRAPAVISAGERCFGSRRTARPFPSTRLSRGDTSQSPTRKFGSDRHEVRVAVRPILPVLEPARHKR